MKQAFKKTERLNEKKLVQKVFKEGNSLFKYPFKVIYLEFDKTTDYPAKVLISVAKRNFKKAVTRNKIKRLIREAYRKNKYLLCDNYTNERKNCFKTRIIVLIYVGKEVMKYQEIEKKINLILQELKHDSLSKQK